MSLIQSPDLADPGGVRDDATRPACVWPYVRQHPAGAARASFTVCLYDRSAHVDRRGAGGRGTRIHPLETFRRFKSGSIFQCFPGASAPAAVVLRPMVGDSTQHCLNAV
jgi:hypothetical protein